MIKFLKRFKSKEIIGISLKQVTRLLDLLTNIQKLIMLYE